MSEPRAGRAPRRPVAALRGLRRSAARSLWRTHREATAFLTKQILLWLWNYLKVVFTPRESYRTYRAPASARPGIFAVPDSCTIALAADWGTGTDSAYAVADAIR